jgi:hypothetical protein
MPLWRRDSDAPAPVAHGISCKKKTNESGHVRSASAQSVGEKTGVIRRSGSPPETEELVATNDLLAIAAAKSRRIRATQKERNSRADDHRSHQQHRFQEIVHRRSAAR